MSPIIIAPQASISSVCTQQKEDKAQMVASSWQSCTTASKATTLTFSTESLSLFINWHAVSCRHHCCHHSSVFLQYSGSQEMFSMAQPWSELWPGVEEVGLTWWGRGQFLSLGFGLVWKGTEKGALPWMGWSSAGSRVGRTLLGRMMGSAGLPCFCWSGHSWSEGEKNPKTLGKNERVQTLFLLHQTQLHNL